LLAALKSVRLIFPHISRRVVPLLFKTNLPIMDVFGKHVGRLMTRYVNLSFARIDAAMQTTSPLGSFSNFDRAAAFELVFVHEQASNAESTY